MNFEKPYSNFGEESFRKLPEEEKKEKVSKLGSEEGAIQQYEYELSLRSKEQPDKELSPEEKEEYEKLKQGVINVLKSFNLKRSLDNQKGENLLVVADSGADKSMLRALSESGKEIAGKDFRLIVVPETKYPSQEFGEYIGERIQTADAVLFITSLSRTHSEETVELLHPQYALDIIKSLLDLPIFSDLQKKYSPQQIKELLESKKVHPESIFPAKTRIISITNTKKETLMEGAALENPSELLERTNKLAELMKDIKKFKITSENGTDLEIDIKAGTLVPDTGIVEKAGQGSNFPNGECGGAVDLEETNGVYVIDGAVGVIGRIEKPIKLTIKNGVVIKIEDEDEAQKLQDLLEKTNKEYREKNPADKITNAFRLAEISLGTNSRAFRYTESGEKISAPTSLEAEKGLGTVHIALGRNTFFEVKKGDPDYNNIPIHIDCIAMKPSVVGVKKSGEEIELIRNGEPISL